MDVHSVGEQTKDLEPVLTDWAASVIEGRLRDQYMGMVPRDTNFVTFYQEPKEIEGPTGSVQIPRMAVFAVISDHPKLPRGPRIMTHGTASATDFEDATAEQRHFVARKDPAVVIFGSVLKQHMEMLNNMKEIIH